MRSRKTCNDRYTAGAIFQIQILREHGRASTLIALPHRKRTLQTAANARIGASRADAMLIWVACKYFVQEQAPHDGLVTWLTKKTSV
jgi:hypothetical protein